MLDDETRAAIADEVLEAVLNDLTQRQAAGRGKLFKIETAVDGARLLAFSGTSKSGYGSFRYYYNPAPVVAKIVSACQRIYTETPIEVGASDESIGGVFWVRQMAQIATLAFLSSLAVRVAALPSDAFDEGMVAAQIGIVGITKKALSIESELNASTAIETIVEHHAARERAELRARFNALPNIAAVPRRGRPPAFTDSEAQSAISRLGGRPSRRALAKALKVEPGTVLNWVRSKGFNTLNEPLNSLEPQDKSHTTQHRGEVA